MLLIKNRPVTRNEKFVIFFGVLPMFMIVFLLLAIVTTPIELAVFTTSFLGITPNGWRFVKVRIEEAVTAFIDEHGIKIVSRAVYESENLPVMASPMNEG